MFFPVYVALILAAWSSAQAADGIALPPPPTGPGGEDSITTSQGVRCSQSINSSTGYVDVGVAGGDLSSSYFIQSQDYDKPFSAVGYARVVIPLGGAPERLDCSSLYKLEIERLKAEIELMQMGLQ